MNPVATVYAADIESANALLAEGFVLNAILRGCQFPGAGGFCYRLTLPNRRETPPIGARPADDVAKGKSRVAVFRVTADWRDGEQDAAGGNEVLGIAGADGLPKQGNRGEYFRVTGELGLVGGHTHSLSKITVEVQP